MAPDHLKESQRMAMLMMMMMMGYLSAPNPFTHLGTKMGVRMVEKRTRNGQS